MAAGDWWDPRTWGGAVEDGADRAWGGFEWTWDRAADAASRVFGGTLEELQQLSDKELQRLIAEARAQGDEILDELQEEARRRVGTADRPPPGAAGGWQSNPVVWVAAAFVLARIFGGR